MITDWIGHHSVLLPLLIIKITISSLVIGFKMSYFPLIRFPSCYRTVCNLVPRSLVDEAEGEIWPNPICITWSPVRNVTGEARAHAQGRPRSAKADFVVYNKLTTCLRHDLRIFARISKFHCFHETKQTQNEVKRFFSTTWPDLFSNTFATVGEF